MVVSVDGKYVGVNIYTYNQVPASFLISGWINREVSGNTWKLRESPRDCPILRVSTIPFHSIVERSSMSEQNATAGPSRPRKPSHPFISANERPEGSDGRFRVVIISSGSVASVKIPDIVGALVKVYRRCIGD